MSPATLVERLRDYAGHGFASDHKTDCLEAAASIDALAAEKQAESVRLGLEIGRLNDALADAVKALEETKNNRDMWKGQCERQGEQIEQRTHFFDWAYRWTWEKEGNGTSDGERLDAIKHHPILTDWAKRTRMAPKP